MFKLKPIIPILVATTITILTVATITTATTIGTNISSTGTLTISGATALNGGLTMDTNKFTVADTSGNTSIAGTLGVTGATTLSGGATLSGNNVLSGISTSTNALVASSTFRVFGTTNEGTGTFIETIAQGTDVLGSTDSNGINLKKYDGTIYTTLGRVDVGGGNYFNGLIMRNVAGDFGSSVFIENSIGEDVVHLGSSAGLMLGDLNSDTASSVNIGIYQGNGVNYRLVIYGNSGSIYTAGSIAAEAGSYPPGQLAQIKSASTTGAQLMLLNGANYSLFTVDSNGDLTLDLGALNATTTISDNFQVEGNLVASSSLQVYGTTSEGTGTFLQTFSQGPLFGTTDGNGIIMSRMTDGLAYLQVGRTYLDPAGYLNAFALRTQPGDFGSVIDILDAYGDIVVLMSDYSGFILGDTDADTASTVDISIYDGAGGTRFQVDGATGNIISDGNIGIGTSSVASDLIIDGGGSATTTMDFNKACFKMVDTTGTVIYYWPSPHTLGGWATSTVSCY